MVGATVVSPALLDAVLTAVLLASRDPMGMGFGTAGPELRVGVESWNTGGDWGGIGMKPSGGEN